jgi:hypothetical protein
VPPASRELTRDEKVENLVMNFSMIMMGMFEGVFTALASGMADALATTTNALTEALDGTGGASQRTKSSADVNTEVGRKLKEVFSGLRKEVAEGFSNKNQAFKNLIKDPSFDQGIRIVESHQLKLPRLTEPLADADLSGYAHLIQSEDPEVSNMMKELGEWQKSTPKFGD